MKKGLLSLGKQALQSKVQALHDNTREDAKVAIKRRAVEGAEKMGKKGMYRAPLKKTVSRK